MYTELKSEIALPFTWNAPH